MKKWCISLTLNLDLFSIPISLYYQGRKKRFTPLGIFLSLFMYGFLLYSFFSSDFYLKENPIIVTQNKKYSHAGTISFDESKVITVSVLDSSGNAMVDPSIFFFTFLIIHEKYNYSTGQFEYISIDNKTLHLCTFSDMNNNTLIYDEVSPENAYCLDNNTFAIEGGWNENEVQFAYIVLNVCNNATSPVTCKSPDEIEDYFTQIRFMCVQYQSALIDFYDYENPMKIEYLFDFPQINYKITKKEFIYLKQAQLSTDKGWLFPSIEEDQNFMYDTSDVDFLERIDDRLFIYQLYASQNVEIDTRRYQKLPEIIASLSGMSKIYVIFFSFIANFVNDFNTMKVILTKLNIVKISGKPRRKVRLPKNTIEMKKSIPLFSEGRFLMSPKQVFNEQNEKLEMKKTKKSKILKSEKLAKKVILQKQSNEVRKSLLFCSERVEKKNIVTEKTTENKETKIQVKEETISLANIPSRKNIPYPTVLIKNTNKSAIFDFSQEEEKINVEIPIETKNLKDSIDPKISNIISNFPEKQVTIGTFAENENKKIEETKIKLSFLEHVLYKFCYLSKKSKKKEIINKIQKTYSKQLDLIHILTKLQDTEKLKKILLDEDQLVIFDFLGKPTIETEEKEKNKAKIRKKEAKKEKFLLSYNKMLQRMNEVDKRLFLLAEDNIENEILNY